MLVLAAILAIVFALVQFFSEQIIDTCGKYGFQMLNILFTSALRFFKKISVDASVNNNESINRI